MSHRQLWLLAWVGLAPLYAQPSVDQILDKYVQSLGGRAACEKITTRAMTGTVEMPDDNVTGSARVVAKAPASFRLTMDIPGYGIVETVLDGASGWQRDPDNGMRAMSKKDLAAALRDHDFYRETRLKELYSKMQVSGAEKLDGRSVYVIEAAAGDGPAEKLYFDAENGLLVKRDFERVTLEDGIVQYEMLYGDYREFEGLKLPARIEQRAPDNTMIFKFSEIKNNAALEATAFAKPEK
jgi:outer membrane lipoprotein-sorting protein